MSIKIGKKEGFKNLLIFGPVFLFFLAISIVGYKNVLYTAKYNVVKDNLPELSVIYTDSFSYSKSVFSEKIWAHRVDGLERALFLASEFKGMEIDVVYDSIGKYFDVGHPPVPSIGLNLETLFSSIPDSENHYFWLDYKNLTEVNKISSCSLLLSLTEKYGLKKNVIVESTNAQALTFFTEKGFYTTYYIPDFDIETSTEKELENYYLEVKSQLEKSNVHALSCRAESLPFVERYFPDTDILLWYIHEVKGLDYYIQLNFLKRKENVKAILVYEPSEGYR